MAGKCFNGESLRRPPESGDGEGAEDSWDWREALIDSEAHMIDLRNHTSARCPVTRKARGGGGRKEDTMQVTFCLAPPPHVSYFCMSYASGDPVRFRYEPRICATEGNLAVIGLVHNRILLDEPSCVYFVYRAPALAHESPELRRLPHPGIGVFPDEAGCHGHLPHGEVGILRYRADGGGDAYKIATLCSHRRSGAKQYDICVYDSGADAWTRTPTAFPRPQDAPAKHLCNRVVTVGGAMGWVDLCRGMLLCDVHVPGEEEEERPGPRLLRYVPLPEPMQPDGEPRLHGLSPFFRDIAVVNGRIKFVDLQLHASPGSPVPDGWTAVTRSMAAGDPGFRKDGEVNSDDILNPLDPSLFVTHPRLSAHDDDVLYLMTNAGPHDDRESWVVAIDTRKKTVERAAKFTRQGEACMDFAYTRTAISGYLAPRDGKGNNMKRRGSALPRYIGKKPRVIGFMPSSGSGYGCDRVEGAGDDGDDMDLD